MPKDKFLVFSPQAVAEIKQIGLKVRQLEREAGLRKHRINQRSTQLYARIDNNVNDSTYEATQVISDNSAVLNTPPTNGLTFGDTTNDVGFLYSIGDAGGGATGVVPIFPYSDGSVQYWGFYWSLNDYTLPFARTIDGSELTIKEGRVFFGSEDEPTGTLIDTDGTWDIATDRKFWVYFTSTPEGNSETAVVNGTLRTGVSDWPPETKDATGDFTNSWRIGELTDGDYTALWENDIHMLYPNQPNFPAEYRGISDDPTTGNFLAVEDGTSIATESGKDIILRARPMRVEGRAGGFRKVYDVGETEVVIGGTGDDIDQNLVSRVDMSTANEIMFYQRLVEHDVEFGLSQKNEVSSEVAHEKITFDEIWLESEVGGKQKHMLANAGNPPIWFTLAHDGTNWSLGDATGTSMSAKIDTAGHWMDASVDGTAIDPPTPDSTNYKYQDCEGADTVVIDSSAGNVIAIGSMCYEFLTITSDDVDSTHSATFTDCTECLDATAFLWRDCTTDTSVAVMRIDFVDLPAFDAAWLCVSSALAKCYNAGPTTAAVNNPASTLDQCDPGAMTLECADLVGWHASENWGGSGCNVGAIDDIAFEIKGFTYNKYAGAPPDPTISGGALAFALASGDAMAVFAANVPNLATGSAEVVVTLGAFTGNTFVVIPAFTIGGTSYAAGFRITAGGARELVVQNGATTVWSAVTGLSVATVKFVADGVNVTVFVNGVLRYTDANTGAFTVYNYGHVDNRASAGNVAATFDNIVILDGSGGQVYVDPTGLACP